MSRDDSILDLAELVMDATALSEALLIGDIQESRFRASLVVENARLLALPSVYSAARAVVNRLGIAGEAPKNGYARAVQSLSIELDGAMARLRG